MKTVAEYAAEHGISTMTVYNRVSKGVSNTSNPVSNPSFIQELFGIIKERDKEIVEPKKKRKKRKKRK